MNNVYKVRSSFRVAYTLGLILVVIAGVVYIREGFALESDRQIVVGLAGICCVIAGLVQVWRDQWLVTDKFIEHKGIRRNRIYFAHIDYIKFYANGVVLHAEGKRIRVGIDLEGYRAIISRIAEYLKQTRGEEAEELVKSFGPFYRGSKYKK